RAFSAVSPLLARLFLRFALEMYQEVFEAVCEGLNKEVTQDFALKFGLCSMSAPLPDSVPALNLST
ncbi:MAG TPA: hypothetical protein DDZ83_05465, partial [Nitrospinae bacterium]|nr:hypothetical protein [Nitrospinota bacterium]